MEKTKDPRLSVLLDESQKLSALRKQLLRERQQLLWERQELLEQQQAIVAQAWTILETARPYMYCSLRPDKMGFRARQAMPFERQW
jgi:hypothetical protein